MKRLNRIIKGLLIVLMLSFTLNLAVPAAEAQTTTSLDTVTPGAETSSLPDVDLGDIPSSTEEAVASAEAEADTETPKDFDGIVSEMDLVAPQSATNSEDIIDGVASMASKVHRLFAPWINYFAFQIGNFLGNDYVYEGAMGDMLHKVWIVSRNIVNIVFVFLLLLLAIKTIFGVSETDMGELKKGLIKFTLLLVFVNFSWLATKVILDAAHVTTQIVFSIPSGISGGGSTGSTGSANLEQCTVDTLGKEPVQGACVPSAILAPANAGTGHIYYWEDNEGEEDNCAKAKSAYAAAYDEEGNARTDLKDDDPNKKFIGRTSICMENLNLFKYDQNTAVIYLTYGMARIQNLVNAVSGTDPIQLSVGVILSLIMQAAYAIALTALFVALVIRMLMLWIFVGFSPFLVLIMWFRDNPMEDYEMGEFKFGWTEFMSWAFVPAKVGVIFVISFIMISAGQSMGDLLINNGEKSGVTTTILEGESLLMGIGSLSTFVWLLMSIAVLWIGTFAVLSKMSIIGNMADTIISQTKQKAATIAKSPLYAPVLPLGGGQTTSVAATVKPFDFNDSMLQKWGKVNQGGENIANVRELNAQAKRVDAEEISALVEGGLKRTELERFTKKRFNLSAKEFATNYTPEQISAALKQAKGDVSDKDVNAIVQALQPLRNSGASSAAPAAAAGRPLSKAEEAEAVKKGVQGANVKATPTVQAEPKSGGSTGSQPEESSSAD